MFQNSSFAAISPIRPPARRPAPGPEATWALYERLTALNISAVSVDQANWFAERPCLVVNGGVDLMQIATSDCRGYRKVTFSDLAFTPRHAPA